MRTRYTVNKVFQKKSFLHEEFADLIPANVYGLTNSTVLDVYSGHASSEKIAETWRCGHLVHAQMIQRDDLAKYDFKVSSQQRSAWIQRWISQGNVWLPTTIALTATEKNTPNLKG